MKTDRFYTNVWIRFLAHKPVTLEPSAWNYYDLDFSGWKRVMWDKKKVGYPYRDFGPEYDQLRKRAEY